MSAPGERSSRPSAPGERSSRPSAPGERSSRPSLPARFVRLAIRAYQVARGERPSACRYWPSCSQYAIEAVELHGARRGTGLAARRLARCHPWGSHGVDPVPVPAGHPRPRRG